VTGILYSFCNMNYIVSLYNETTEIIIIGTKITLGKSTRQVQLETSYLLMFGSALVGKSRLLRAFVGERLHVKIETMDIFDTI